MLYFIPTPIGNLKDITLRALEVLKSVDLILCENPRHSQKLLQAHEIKKQTKQFNQFSSDKLVFDILAQVKAGKEVAYISDAGMPGISDPGTTLVAQAIEKQIPFTVLPGSNASLPAVVASGFLVKEFYFAGFLPLKKGRQKKLTELLQLPVPVVLYESPYRLNKLLSELVTLRAGDRPVYIGRELSKLHEEHIYGTAQALAKKYADKQWKGELVIVLRAPQNPSPS
ncbi:MAG: 16S rRNA (cytidine(1402)-2'-O)-methyltransferase [Candidatus Abawacabacteria bacterium]|nr:16S rRNA (cytidine(1402)-2'-O)-methyltransferase [Candidatus Abawacabacteria bacterium]